MTIFKLITSDDVKMHVQILYDFDTISCNWLLPLGQKIGNCPFQSVLCWGELLMKQNVHVDGNRLPVVEFTRDLLGLGVAL